MGQIYCGELNKGLFFYVLFWAFHVTSLFIALTVLHAPFNLAGAILLWLLAFFYIARDAVRSAKLKRTGYTLKVFNRWYVYLLIILAGSLAVQPTIKYTLIQAYKIPSGSMRPTLEIGDQILVNKLTFGFRSPITRTCLALCKSPKRGDVIVFIFPEDRTKDFVMRVVAVAGDTVEIRNGKLYIGGNTIEEPYTQFSDEDIGKKDPLVDNYGPKKVPDNHLFVLGDLRDRSYDSRYWGYVDVADVKGKAAVIYWSWDTDAQIIRLERIGKPIE